MRWIAASFALALAVAPQAKAQVAAGEDSIRLAMAAFDSRPTLAEVLPGPGGREPAFRGRRNFALGVVRDWPEAVAVGAGRIRLDLTPHAGFGVSSSGAQAAEAGAQVKLRKRALQLSGVPGLGEDSPFYLYAGASRRALGLGVLRSEDGPAKLEDGFVKTHQLGVGFEHGLLHAAFGYTHENTKLKSPSYGPRTDNRIGLTLSIR